MDPANTGPQNPAGQDPAATPVPQQSAEQAPQQQQAAAPQQQANAATQSPTPEQIATWQAQAEKTAQIERSYNELRGEYTRTRQQIAALTNPQQQQQADPLAPYVKMYTDAGVDEAQAKLLAQNQYAMVQPLMQQNQQLQAAVQGSSMVTEVMRQAWQKVPQALSDPVIVQQVESELRQVAMRGQPIDPDYVIDMAAILTQRNAWTGKQTPPPQQIAPSFGSQFGPASAFNGVSQRTQAQPTQLSPEQQAASDAVRAYWGLPAKNSPQAS